MKKVRPGLQGALISRMGPGCTHRVFVPSASFGPSPAPSEENPKGHPQVLSGTFNVQIFER